MTLLRTLIAVSLFTWANLSTAVVLPSWYPESFNHGGTVDRLDIRKGEIVIGDGLFRLPENLSVHTLTRRTAGVDSLVPGILVGFELARDTSGRRMVTEIWVLPDNYFSDMQ